MSLKFTFLEGKRRKSFFQTNPPIKVYVFSSRANVAKGGGFTTVQANGMQSPTSGSSGKRGIRTKNKLNE